jgi:hypothetical protein
MILFFRIHENLETALMQFFNFKSKNAEFCIFAKFKKQYFWSFESNLKKLPNCNIQFSSVLPISVGTRCLALLDPVWRNWFHIQCPLKKSPATKKMPDFSVAF